MNLDLLSLIETNHIILKEISDMDLQDIINLRRFKTNNHLSPINSNLIDQINYYKIYKKKRYENSEIYYKIADKKNPNTTVGLVRLTEVNSPVKFSWESLIVADGVAPYIALDAMMSIYRIGFEKLKRDICGPWTIPINAKNVYNLHLKIGMASEVKRDEDSHYMAVQSEDFFNRFPFYKKIGYGLYRI